MKSLEKTLESFLDKSNKKDTKIGQIITRLTQLSKEYNNAQGFNLGPDESLNITMDNGRVDIVNTYKQCYFLSMDMFLQLMDLGVTELYAKYEYAHHSVHVDIYAEQGTYSNRTFKGEICRHIHIRDGVVTFKGCKFENNRITIDSPFTGKTVRFEDCEFTADSINIRMQGVKFTNCKFNTEAVYVNTDMNSFDWKATWNKFILNTKKGKSSLKDIGLAVAPKHGIVVSYERWPGIASNRPAKGTLIIVAKNFPPPSSRGQTTIIEVDGYNVQCNFGQGPNRKDKLV